MKTKNITKKEQAHNVDVLIGSRIRYLRMQRGLSQSELGDAMGVTFQQTQKIECASNRISSGALFLAAQKFGLTVSDIFDGIELEMNQPPDRQTQHPTKLQCKVAHLFSKLDVKRQEAIHKIIKLSIEMEQDKP